MYAAFGNNYGMDFVGPFFDKPGNKFFYEHWFVAEADGQIVGAAFGYPGADWERLVAPITASVAEKTNRPFLTCVCSTTRCWALDYLSVYDLCHHGIRGPGSRVRI